MTTPKKWSGDEYKKIQALRKKASANRMIHTGRGTGSRKSKNTGSK